MADERAAVRTMVVWCLDWPVVAAGVGPDHPAMVLHANRVVATSSAARARGVQRGLRRRDAQRRCPEVEVIERDEALEARRFETIASIIEAFTPRIEVTRPGRCAFATRGPARYFGGDRALAEQILERIDAELDGVTACRIGVADGPFAAGLAARTAQAAASGVEIVDPGDTRSFLAPLAVTTLERPELTDVLLRLGLRSLGDLAALSSPDVLGRFGHPGLAAHRLALGLDEHPPDARTPPPDLMVMSELDPPIQRVDQAAFLARTLADELHRRLDHDGLCCTRIAIEVETEHGETLSRLWRHEGALSAGAIADRVRWQLDGWLNAAPAARPTGAMVNLALVPDEVRAATGRQLGFWGGETAADERAGRAFARVQGLMHADAVQVPELHGGRCPGAEVRLVSLAGVDLVERPLRPVGTEPAPWPGAVPTPSPALVAREFVAASVVDADGEEISVTGRGLASAAPRRFSIGRSGWTDIAGWAGPWLYDERWWDQQAHRRRARFQIVGADGAAFWFTLEGGRWWAEAAYD